MSNHTESHHGKTTKLIKDCQAYPQRLSSLFSQIPRGDAFSGWLMPFIVHTSQHFFQGASFRHHSCERTCFFNKMFCFFKKGLFAFVKTVLFS
jgi:hypothetical protein